MRQCLTELLSAMQKADFCKLNNRFCVGNTIAARNKAQNNRIHLWRWHKYARGHYSDHLHGAVELRGKRKHAHIARVRHHALPHFFLHHHNEAIGKMIRPKHAFKNRVPGVIRKIAHKNPRPARGQRIVIHLRRIGVENRRIRIRLREPWEQIRIRLDQYQWIREKT